MTDIASLRFSIDVGDISKAEESLEQLTQAGQQADKTAADLRQSWSSVGQSSAYAANQAKSASTAFQSSAAAIGRVKDSLGGADDALKKTGISAGQTANAIRMLPAQFTDIFTSLASGQAPLTVLIQQGGQIKDSFGGVGNALRETAAYARTLINPYTLAAAAAAALALAYKQGSDEATAFNEAIILTGNSAGTSANRLASAAKSIDSVVGTQRQAAAALAEIASTSKFTASQIETIGLAAVAMEDATGKAISDTVDEFKSLADAPSDAVAKLNEKYNFLTSAVYEQISALEAQGDAAGAAQLAIDTFAQTMNDRANEITDNLGYIESAWKGIKNSAAEAWDEMLGVGRAETPEDRLDGLQGIDFGKVGGFALLTGPVGAAANFGKQLYDRFSQSASERNAEISGAWQEIQDEDEKAWVEGLAAAQEQNGIKAQRRIDALTKDTLTNAQKREKALEQLRKDLADIRAVNPNDARLQAENVAKLEASIAEKFKDPAASARKPQAFRDDAATKLLASLREQEAALSLQLTTTDKLTKAEQDRAKFEQQITDLKAKDQLTAEQQSLLNNQDAIRAQLDKNVAIEREVTLRQKAADEAQKLAAFEGVLADNMQRARDSLDLALTGVGRGDKVQKQLQEQLKIQQDFAAQQSRLQEQFKRGDISEDLYGKETEALSRALDERLKLQEQYYVKDAEARANWLNGVTKSFEDYVDSAQDISGQTEQLFGKALGGIEDEFVNLATTGKASFRDLADSILADIARIGVRSLISNAIIGAGFGSEGAQTQGIDFGSLLSSVGSFFGGGRATGGSVQSGKFYEVGEGNKPELFMAGGKQYLIPGNNGAVVPNSQMGGAAPVINIDMSGVRDRREAREASATAARTISRAVAGSGRYA